MTLRAANNARLVARIPEAAHDHAQKILQSEAVVRLTRQQTKRVFELLDRPPHPSRALLGAKAAHCKLIRA